MFSSHAGIHRGVPIRLKLENDQTSQIDPNLIPDAAVAVEEFEETGGHLTTFSSFGEDPLQRYPHLVAQREAEFYGCYPDFSQFFHTTANGDFFLFREGILFFIHLSKTLETQL